MRTLNRIVGCLTLGLATLTALPAQATYTVIAVDTEEGLVGGAGTSCVGRNFGWSLHDVGYAAVPGQAALVAQGYFGLDAYWGQLAYSLVDRGVSAESLAPALSYVDALWASSNPAVGSAGWMHNWTFDHGQFAAVTLEADDKVWSSQFTNGNSNIQGDSTVGTLGVRKKKVLTHGFRYAIQGNILEDAPAVIHHAERGFRKDQFAQKSLGMRLAEAAFHGGDQSGDDRCVTPASSWETHWTSIPGDSAFLRLDDSSGQVVQIKVDFSCPNSATTGLPVNRYEGDKKPECVDPTQEVLQLFRQCNPHLKEFLKHGVKYPKINAYYDTCFVHVDGRDDSILRGQDTFVDGAPAPSALEEDIL